MQDILNKVRVAIEFSNKVLIRELVKDFEDKGIAPVWNFDGQSVSLGNASDSCKQIIFEAINSCGLNYGDFCIMQDLKRNLVILINKGSGEVSFYDSRDDLHGLVLQHLKNLS